MRIHYIHGRFKVICVNQRSIEEQDRSCVRERRTPKHSHAMTMRFTSQPTT